ncbi:MAG: hypothetical protein PHS14_04335 [Elusimicrobia bacterium]|nr:hypothetical protein [Elusimicrobiota bacterium]
MRKILAVSAGALILSAVGASSQTFEQQVFLISRTAAVAAQQTRQKFAPPATPGPSAKDQETLRAAREAYYSLKANGFQGMKADVELDWSSILGRAPSDDERQIFDDIKFQVSVDAKGSASVTFSTPPPINEQQRVGFGQITSGMSQMLAGFFQTWSGFMIEPPLPSPSAAFQLQREAKLYRLSYKEGDAEISTTLMKNFAITKLETATPDFQSTLKPVFSATEDGFVLAGYDADYVSTSGSGKTVLKVELSYQDVDGVRLVKGLVLDSVYEGQPTHVKIEFKNCTVQKRAP